MVELTLTTLDWVPEFPRGYVRDLRVRWALEEAGLPYRIATTPFEDAEARLPFQPFGQVPWLTDGDVTLFEAGAILLHLGERSEALMPVDPAGRADVLQWVFAAQNSIETAALPWLIWSFAEDDTRCPGCDGLDAYLDGRLDRLEAALAGREWLAGRFSVADILMADALRLFDDSDLLTNRPACRAYLERATARPAFLKAHADQIAHFEAADAEREARAE